MFRFLKKTVKFDAYSIIVPVLIVSIIVGNGGRDQGGGYHAGNCQKTVQKEEFEAERITGRISRICSAFTASSIAVLNADAM